MRSNIAGLAREFLEAGCPAGSSVLKQLNSFAGNFNAVMRALRPGPAARLACGWHLKQPFKKPELAAKYPGEQLQYHVPRNYSPSRPAGLLLFMHGGGTAMARDSGYKVYEKYGFTDIFENCGRIVCFPCCPYNEKSFAGWNLESADEYLADVVEELEYLFAIDPDNMILGGHSMGGLGAYHHAQRFADRFASVLACAGAWDFGYWPSVKGATMWLVQGINDAWMFKRRHGSDIEFARLARRRLLESGVEVMYREHSGSHAAENARPFIHEWLEWSRKKRRDPFYRHVVAVTPRGCTPWIDFRRHKTPLAAGRSYVDFRDIPPSPHARWVCIDKIHHPKDTLVYDMVDMAPDPLRDRNEKDWNAYELKLRRKHIPGALVEAVARGDGVIEVAPRNVERLTLWLHPKLVNFKNVRVIIRGKERHNGPVRPSLATMLESYRRRRDWGLLYPAKLSFEAEASWFEGDQMKLASKWRMKK